MTTICPGWSPATHRTPIVLKPEDGGAVGISHGICPACVTVLELQMASPTERLIEPAASVPPAVPNGEGPTRERTQTKTAHGPAQDGAGTTIEPGTVYPAAPMFLRHGTPFQRLWHGLLVPLLAYLAIGIAVILFFVLLAGGFAVLPGDAVLAVTVVLLLWRLGR